MIKKIALTLSIVAFAANSFAQSATVTIATDVTAIKFVPSKSVILGYQSSAGSTAPAGSTANSVYSIAAKNTAGDKAFATTSSSTAIVWRAAPAGVDLSTATIPSQPADPTDSAITGGGTGWVAL